MSKTVWEKAIDELRDRGIDVDAALADDVGRHDEETYRLVLMVAESRGDALVGAGWVQRQPGADGIGLWDQPRKGLRFIHSIARYDGDAWAHFSLSRRDRVLPTWEQTRDGWRLLYPDLAGVIVVASQDQHVDLGEVMHVWGNLSRPAVPEFGKYGTI